MYFGGERQQVDTSPLGCSFAKQTKSATKLIALAICREYRVSMNIQMLIWPVYSQMLCSRTNTPRTKLSPRNSLLLDFRANYSIQIRHVFVKSRERPMQQRYLKFMPTSSLRARASSCRTRSRVTPRSLPTESRVLGGAPPHPHRETSKPEFRSLPKARAIRSSSSSKTLGFGA